MNLEIMRRNPNQTKENVRNMKEFWCLFARFAVGGAFIMAFMMYIIYKIHKSNKNTLKNIKKELILNGKDTFSAEKNINRVNIPTPILAF
jgi:hypothetical protein